MLQVILALVSRLFLIGGSFKSFFASFLVLFTATTVISTVVKLLLSLGVGYVSYSLGDYTLDFIFQKAIDSSLELPEIIIQFLALFRIDEFISIIFSAASVRFSLHIAGAGGLINIPRFFNFNQTN